MFTMFSFIYNWLLICQFLVVVEAQGGKPSDNVIRMFYYVVGEDALLPCDNVDADWQYVNLSTSIKPRDIASSGQVVWTLLAKYSMEKASDGSADVGLIVHNASYDDAGIYCCSKDLQRFRYMHLVIEEVSPKIEETAQIATVPSTSDVITDLQSCENDDSRLIFSFVFNVIFFALFVVFAVSYLRLRRERRTMRHRTHREETVDQDEQVELNPADQHHSDQQKPVWKENITEGNRNVRNFAKLRDRTYVAFRREIHEYLDQFETPSQIITIPEEVCCKYFSAHITSNCLYIADDQNHCVWRTKLDPGADDKDRTIKWYNTTDDNKNIECVSVRSDEEIVVLLRDEFWGGHYWKGQLVICNMNGEGTNTINLLSDLINPYAVTCTSPQEGTFLVAFEGGLKEINKEGRPVRSCSRKFKLTHPRKCYYDRKSKCIFVIDVGHMRLLQLNRTLSSSKTVMQWTSNDEAAVDSHPVRVHYDSGTKLLTVGMLSGRISVFTYSV